jgi:hypothetical protein
MHCLLIAPRTALCTIIVSDGVIICSAIFNNASAVENFIPVFSATLLKLVQWPHVDQINSLETSEQNGAKSVKSVNNF